METNINGNIEVSGSTVKSFIDGVGTLKKSKTKKILKRNGIVAPQDEKWYSLESWLNSLREIIQEFGGKIVYQIGKSIPRNAKFPEGINTLGRALNSINHAYHMNHRGGDIGFYKVERLDNNQARVICHNPYPCNFDKGVIISLTKMYRTLRSKNYAVVEHDDSKPCRTWTQIMHLYY